MKTVDIEVYKTDTEEWSPSLLLLYIGVGMLIHTFV